MFEFEWEPTIDEGDMVCGNCEHWDTDNMVTITAKTPNELFGKTSYKRAPCELESVEVDAGFGAIAMLGPESHCRCHAGNFEPSKDFLKELAEQRDIPVHPNTACLPRRYAA